MRKLPQSVIRNSSGSSRFSHRPRTKPLGTRMVFEVMDSVNGVGTSDGIRYVQPNRTAIWFHPGYGLPKPGELVVAELVDTEYGFYDEDPSDPDAGSYFYFIGGIWKVINEKKNNETA